MSELVWDVVSERFYTSGVDRGVLYLQNGDAVVWNGLVSVDVDEKSYTSNPYYLDGVKVIDQQVFGDFTATLSAYTYPEEFLQFEGTKHLGGGVFAGDQRPDLFALSWREKVGSAVDEDEGYIIHVAWNLSAVPNSRTRDTISDFTDPLEFDWELESIPEPLDGYRPTAHALFDTRYLDPNALYEVEAILYGNADRDAKLTTLQELVEAVVNIKLITIIDNGDGTWTAIGRDDLITMLDSTTFQIDEANAVFIDADTYEISDTIV